MWRGIEAMILYLLDLPTDPNNPMHGSPMITAPAQLLDYYCNTMDVGGEKEYERNMWNTSGDWQYKD